MPSRIWKVTKLVLLTAVGLAFAVVGGATVYRGYRQHQNAKLFAIDTPRGISAGQFVKIGGIDQWIQIRGEDTGNPVLLVLHGGPGSSYVPATPIFRQWEKSFTVVQWDQRGCGRTFGRDGKGGSGEMSIDRMAADGIEVTQYLRQRLGKDKIIIYGTSWGTILGATMAKRHPELFYVYVGSGQMVDARKGETIGYDTLMRTVRRANDRKALSALSDSGPPPYKSLAALGVERHWFYQYASPVEKHFVSTTLAAVVFAPDYSIRDILDYDAGSTFSITTLFQQMESVDLRSLGMQFQVPMIFIQGADDTLTPTSLLQEYYASLDAPQKQLILIPGAGHLVSLAMSDQVLVAFLKYVRPLARTQGAPGAMHDNPAGRTAPLLVAAQRMRG